MYIYMKILFLYRCTYIYFYNKYKYKKVNKLPIPNICIFRVTFRPEMYGPRTMIWWTYIVSIYPLEAAISEIKATFS